MARFGFYLTLFLSIFYHPQPAAAVTPIRGDHDLVAGQGQAGFAGNPGFLDGTFTESRFNAPAGMALSSNNNLLYVADTKNNRIRVVHLNDMNRVDTLTGDGQAVDKDGPVSLAEFNQPSALAFLPGDLLAVTGRPSPQIRIIDLKNGAVTTWGGNGAADAPLEGDPAKINFSNIWNLAFLPADNSLYFSQPDSHLLRKLDLKTRHVSIVFNNDPSLPQPQALCLYKNGLCVSDRSLPGPLLVHPTKSADGKPLYDADPFGNAVNLVALAPSGDLVYGLAWGGQPLWITNNPAQPVTLFSTWGFELSNALTMVYPLFNFGQNSAPGFLPDPTEERRFLVAAPEKNCVVSWVDRDFDQYKSAPSLNKEGLSDFTYSYAKPKGTFRLLVVGDSHTLFGREVDGRGWGYDYNRTQTFPKKLELFLNSEAALQDSASHFQVLTQAHPSYDEDPLFLWPYYRTPSKVKDFDVDEICMFVAARSTIRYEDYYLWPETSTGIPASIVDSEYLMKPVNQRIPPGAPKRFLDKCIALGFAKISEDKRSIIFDEVNDRIVSNDQTRPELVEMMGKPIGMMADKFRAMKTTDGKPVSFFICYSPGSPHGQVPDDAYREFWREIGAKYNIPFVDLSDGWYALQTTYYPTNDGGWWDHFDAYGHQLLAYLMARTFINQHRVPIP